MFNCMLESLRGAMHVACAEHCALHMAVLRHGTWSALHCLKYSMCSLRGHVPSCKQHWKLVNGCCCACTEGPEGAHVTTAERWCTAPQAYRAVPPPQCESSCCIEACVDFQQGALIGQLLSSCKTRRGRCLGLLARSEAAPRSEPKVCAVE
jgi:hypothetical protein